MGHQISSLQPGNTLLKRFDQGAEGPVTTNAKIEKLESDQNPPNRQTSVKMQIYHQNGAISNTDPTDTGKNIDLKI